MTSSLSKIPTGKGGYDEVNYYENRYRVTNYSEGSTWNPHFAMWRAIDVNTSLLSNQDGSEFDELNESKLEAGIYELDHHEMFQNPTIGRTRENTDAYKNIRTC